MLKISSLPPLVFEISEASLGMPGMPDHTHLNLHNEFMTLINMKLHAQNQLYILSSLVFEILKS